jgi:hypothetical protein
VGYLNEEIYKPDPKDFFISPEFNPSEVGFFLGAGSSKEGGYPLTLELTTDVLKKLETSTIEKIQQILEAQNLTLDVEKGSPDIELINDLVMTYRVESGGNKALENEIKKKTVSCFYQDYKSDIKWHNRFIKVIKRRLGNLNSVSWILSTNYDLLIEEACAENQMPIENGFLGTTKRCFFPEVFKYSRGEIQGKTFSPWRVGSINLVKLHGSLSWNSYSNKCFENYDLSTNNKSLIMPCRKKIIETLEPPFDSLFRISSQVLGTKVKYLIACGHTFRDSHINDTLFLPKLKEGKITIMALFGAVPENIDNLLSHRNFNYISARQAKVDGKIFTSESELWKFSKLVEFLEDSIQ